MKKKLVHLSLLLLFAAQYSYAQLPNGSIAPNWTMTDLNGVSHTLYDMLNQDKVVFLDFSATWCVPCWNYHNSGALENLYFQYGPGTGEDKVRVFMIEGDGSTNTACLYGTNGCVGGTTGNWVAGTPYPIIDNASQTGAYGINYWPTIYGVCPDKKIYEVGQQGTAAHWNWAQTCPNSPPAASLVAVTNVLCNGGTTGAISISASGVNMPLTYQWSNGATTPNISNIPAGDYTVTVTGSNGGATTVGPIAVTQPAAPVVSTLAYSLPTGCNGLLGSAAINVNGGTPGYTIVWNNGMSGPVNPALPIGNYSVTTTDANGCSTSLQNIMVEGPAAMTAVAAASGTVSCTNNMVTLSGLGSTVGSEISYVWTTTNGNIVSGETSLTNCVVDQAGTYELLIVNGANTCDISTSIEVTGNTVAPTASAGAPATLSCNSSQAILSGSGSTGSSYNYLWTASNGGNIVSGATTLSPVVNAGGTYTLTVTNNGNGCTTASSTTVTAGTTPPNVSASGGQITCTASQVQLQGGSTTQGVSYNWAGPAGYSSNQASPTVSALGTYTLTVTNGATGCTSTASAEVTPNTTAPNATATGGTLNCLVNSVNVAGNSTTTGATYSWALPGGGTSSAQNVAATASGNYVLTVTGTNGCTQTATAVVSQNINQPTANAGANGVLNCTSTSVLLNGSASSSGPQFSYAWTTADGSIASGETTATPTVDGAGTYALLVTNNNNGCTNTASTIVTQTPPVTAGIAAQANATCFGSASGTASVEAGGGNGTYTYAWSNGASTSSVENLSAGTYTVVVSDGENCTASQSVTIGQPAELLVSASANAQSAPGVMDGSASANATGGNGSYTYLWSNGETSETINNLAPGNYGVVVTDGNGCSKTQTVTVNVFGCAVSASVTSADASCNGSNDGTASIALGNALDPIEYVWSNDETTQAIANLAPGTYTVSATDGNGCEIVTSVEIEEPALLLANTTATGLTATNANNGTATANPTGGTGPFTYEWSNGGTTATISDLASANYTVIVTDANGCSAEQTVPVAPFGCSALASVSSTNISCNGAADGQATVVLTGGLSPYSYEWSNEATTATINGLGAGTYSVAVMDAVGCEAITEVTIAEPALLEAVISEYTNTDCGSNNGTATVIATGGMGTTSYIWSTGETTPTVSGLAAGSYVVTIKDANDCSTSVEVEISVDDSEAPMALVQNLNVTLNATGVASITPSQVDNGSSDNCDIATMTIDQNSFTCDDLGEQEVTLTVTDEAGNVSTATAIVTVKDNMQPSIVVTNIFVSLDENGQAVLEPEMLDNGSQDNCGITEMTLDVTSFDCSNLGENAVVLTVKDASGNSNSGTAIVTIQDKLAPVVQCPENMVLPYCEATGIYEVSATDNCDGTLTYNMVSGLPSGSTFPAGATSVEIEVKDESDNATTCTFSITVGETMELATNGSDVSCFGEADGKITTTVSGGSPVYTYTWSNGATTPAIENLPGGTYSVVVKDADGCTETQTLVVEEPTALATTVNNLVNETNGQHNGAIEITVSGGTGPYSFEWKNAAGQVISNEEDVNGLSGGTYQLEVTDANGCVMAGAYTIQSTTAINDTELARRISLYPNPTSDRATIEVAGAQFHEADVAVYDMTGRLLSDFPNAAFNGGKYELELSGLPSGMYTVKLVVGGQQVAKRLMKINSN